MNIKVCFVSLENTPLFFPEYKQDGRTGGSQVQQDIIGRTLFDTFEVHFVIEDLGQKRDFIKKGIFLHTAYSPEKGIRRIRFIYPRLTSIWKAMKRANADIYYQRVPGSLTGIVALFCKLYRKKFVYALANDNELLEKWKLFHYKIERKLFNLGLKNADLITVQNEFQKSELFRKRNLESTLVNNIYNGNIGELNHKKKYILSVGMVNPKKQIEKIIKIAEKLTEYKFVIIGKGEGVYFNNILTLTKRHRNLIFLSNLSREQTLSYYKNAFLLLHTSMAEGFPNVFLEAWAHGIPVVSLKLDPGGFIEKYKLGFVVDNIGDILEKIKLLANEQELRKHLGANATDHIRNFHRPESVKSVYVHSFIQLLDKHE